jgi:hypothetical protein
VVFDAFENPGGIGSVGVQGAGGEDRKSPAHPISV